MVFQKCPQFQVLTVAQWGQWCVSVVLGSKGSVAGPAQWLKGHGLDVIAGLGTP